MLMLLVNLARRLSNLWVPGSRKAHRPSLPSSAYLFLTQRRKSSVPEHANRVLARRQLHLAGHGRRRLGQALHYCITLPGKSLEFINRLG